MNKNNVLCSYLLDGQGGGKKIPWKEVKDWSPEKGILWLLLDGNTDDTKKWLQKDPTIDPLIVEILITEDGRPRFFELGNGMLIILKGMNVNPNADPEDMVSLRIWIEKSRVISVYRHQICSVAELEKKISFGEGPKNTTSFIVQIARLMLDKMEPIMDLLDEKIDEIEKNYSDDSEKLIDAITDIRIKATTIKRYLVPQKEAMMQLQLYQVEWFDKKYKKFIREHIDRTYRFLEDLDLVKERASILLDEMRNKMQGRMTKTMYIFSLVAVLFLPMTFLTGLFGINVGGIPGSNEPLAFTIFCASMVLLVSLTIYVFRKLRWF